MFTNNVLPFPLPLGTKSIIKPFSRHERENQIIDYAFLLLKSQVRVGEALTSPDATKRYLQMKVGDLEYEVFGIVCLDNRHRVVSIEELFRGTIDGAAVYPREVVKHVLKHNAAAVIFYHNHPSGVCEPSSGDKSITQRLKQALDNIDVRVLDHLIVSRTGNFSFAEVGNL